MPRSASTLQFNIAWKVATAAGIGLRVEWQSSASWETPKAGIKLKSLIEDSKLHVIKMHFPPESVKQIASEIDGVKYVYVHRDIRDVVVSMKVKFKFTIARAVRRISESLELERWLLKCDKNDVLVQEYEMLLLNLPKAVQEISDFFGVKLSEPQISAIADELNINAAYDLSRQKKVLFEHTRRRIKMLFGGKITFADDELMLHPEHVSKHKGEIGIWKDALSAEEVSMIEDNFKTRIASGFHV
jgi:hypothetical protein